VIEKDEGWLISMVATKKPKSRSDESPEFQAVIKETVALLLGGYTHDSRTP
jgi:hypothetical protein